VPFRLRWQSGKAQRPGEKLWERNDPSTEHARLCRARLRCLVEVREPLVLISQIQRSGGTLLSELFDGHLECHAHPGELRIGKPKKWDWPLLDLDRPETWFETLFEESSYQFLRNGYKKSGTFEQNPELFPFLFSVRLQKDVFDQLVRAWQPSSERDVLDVYMSSYFNAWLDNRNLYGSPKKIVTAHVPRLVMEEESLERFFATYPDGRLISIVREPRVWYGSAQRHRAEYRDVEAALRLWRRSAEAGLAAADRFGDRVFLLTFESLVVETEETMQRLAGLLGLTMSPILLEPTFNGWPIRANSSEPVLTHGVLAERASAYRDSLDADTIAQIDRLAADLYAQVAERTVRPQAVAPA
jgi:hypothetical protein